MSLPVRLPRRPALVALAAALAIVPVTSRAQSPRPASADTVHASELRAAVRGWRERNEAAILRELVELVRLPNVARDSAAIRGNAALLVRMLESRDVRARLLESPTGGPPAVYGELMSPGATRTVVFYAHYDGQPVVPAQWTTGPWEPTLRDASLQAGGREIAMPADGGRVSPEARLYARSASDDKAPIVAMLAALDALRATGHEPSVNVKFFLEGEEEAGSPNLRELLEHHAALLEADAWLFGDGPRHPSGAMQVVHGVRGVMGLQLTVYGPARPLHSGHFGNWAPNPAAMLARLVASMRDDDGTITIAGFGDQVREPTAAEREAIDALPDTDRALAASLALGRLEGAGERLMERIMRPSLNVTGLDAGGVGDETSNTIRTSATAAIDFRLVPDQTPAEVRRLVEAHLQSRGYHVVHAEPDSATRVSHPRVARLDWGDGYAAVRTDLSLPVSRAVAAVVGEAVEGPVLRVPMLGGSLPMAHFTEVLGAPLLIVPIVNADNNQHAADENLRLGNLWEGVEIYAQLLGRLGAVWR